jgi:hypothetical protein
MKASASKYPFSLSKEALQLFQLAIHQNDNTSSQQIIVDKRFFQLAQLSHLSGFAYRNLKLAAFEPTEMLSWRALEMQYLKIDASNHAFIELLTKLQPVLEKAQIPYAVLKGMDLLFRTYQETGIRHISDIDLLIRPQDLDKLQTILTQLGFSCKPSIDKSAFHEKHFQLHAPLQASFNGLNIDVHILLFDTFLELNFSTEKLLWNRTKVSWKDQYTWVLNAKDAALFNLLHLWVHLDKGNHFKMSSFIDVYHTLKELDYPSQKNTFSKSVQRKIEEVIDCMIWLGLLEDNYLPNRKAAPSRYFFYLKFFLQELKPTLGQQLRYKFLPRLFLYSFSWKTLPLLFFEAFPSKRYLNYTSPNRSYLTAWLLRLGHFTRKK